MKKRIARVLCMLLVLCALLSLAACQKNGLPGTYHLVSARVNGTDYGPDGLRTLGLDPQKCTLQIRSDNTAVFTDGLIEHAYWWNDSQIWSQADNADVSNYTLEGNRLTLTQGETVLTFEK